MKNQGAKIFVCIFWVMISGIGITYLLNCNTIFSVAKDSEKTVNKKIEEVNSFFDDGIIMHDTFIELYGASQKVLGKKEIENFSYVITQYGKIQQLRKKDTEQEIRNSVKNINTVFNHAHANH